MYKLILTLFTATLITACSTSTSFDNCERWNPDKEQNCIGGDLH